MLVAPLFAGIGFGVIFFAKYPNDFMKLLAAGKVSQMLLPNPYITPISYGATLLLGLPAYILLAKYRLIQFYYVVAAGGLIGLMVHVALSMVLGRSNAGSDPLPLIIPGMFVAGCFSLIVHLCSVQPEKSKEQHLQ
jgi:ABC-type Fe3+-siderophore transport system permease subunit